MKTVLKYEKRKDMKTKEELEQIKIEYVELKNKLAELSEDELKQVMGGIKSDMMPPEINTGLMQPGMSFKMTHQYGLETKTGDI